MKVKPPFFERYRVHAVTGLPYLDEPDFLRKAGEVAASGLAAINLRAHHLEGGPFYRLACKLKEITAGHGVPLIVNDRLDVALAVEADCVHLGRRSIPPESAGAFCRERSLRWGYSCHSLEEGLEAQKRGAAYLYLGTIFRSASKPDAQSSGIKLVEQVCGLVKIPVFAIGGIDQSNAEEVARAGAYGAAAISSVWDAENLREAIYNMSRAFKGNY